MIYYGLKKYLREKYIGLVKNANHFTFCLDKLVKYGSNQKQLDTYMLYILKN